MKTYNKYALCVIKDNRCCSRGGWGGMLSPARGRAEDGEGAIQALCREVKEELG
jgi:8-oxo-dGTP pyrophosphatase MutT (NUDIX family)